MKSNTMPSQGIAAKDRIKELATVYEQEIIAVRNHIHENPELSFKECKTASFVKQKLKEYGISKIKTVVKTGVIAEIDSGKPGKTIALRADMDALPIQEDSRNPFCSRNQGVMHACGHDMHTASLLGTARILNASKADWKGKVILIFQPGEEYMPSGAKMILESGALSAYKIDWIIGQHCSPELETGKVGFKAGSFMASTDELFLTVKGKGGHGAFPHLLNDTVLAASQIIIAAQHIVSRRKNPVLPPSVLSFGKFIADGATNIIPDKVEIAGTLRCMDEIWRKEAKELLISTAKHTASVYGADCDVNINHGYPSVYNNEKLTDFAYNTALELLGDGQVQELPVRMGGEDFGFYTQHYPATFYRFGVKSAQATVAQNLHTPEFFGDEKALHTSMATMAYLAYSFLDLN